MPPPNTPSSLPTGRRNNTATRTRLLPSRPPLIGARPSRGITLTTEVEAVTVTVVSLSIRIWGHRFGRATTTSRWRQFTASHIHMILALPTIPQPNTLTRAHRLLLRLFITRKAITVVSTIVVAEVEDIETGFAGVVVTITEGTRLATTVTQSRTTRTTRTTATMPKSRWNRSRLARRRSARRTH